MASLDAMIQNLAEQTPPCGNPMPTVIVCVSTNCGCEMSICYCRSIALARTLSQLHVHACRPELASTQVARAN